MNTNLIKYFFNGILSYSKKYTGISTADIAIPVNLTPYYFINFTVLYPLSHLLFVSVK